MLSYKEIKKELLKSENIFKVSIDSNKKDILITPIQNKDFYTINEPIKKYCYEAENGKNIYKIGDRDFKLTSYGHFNTTIYLLCLKEID